jgi:hypothetical protein
MDSHHAVPTRFAHHARDQSRTRRIIHGGKFNNGPITAHVALHSRKTIER